MYFLTSLTAVIIISMVHLFVGRCRVFNEMPRSAWLSASGGAAVAYVFVYILPKLPKLQKVLGSASDEGFIAFLEHHAYLVALTGFIAYYGIDRAAEFLKNSRFLGKRTTKAGSYALYLHVIGFSAYNLITGLLIADISDTGFIALMLISLAMGLHFLGVDHGLEHQQPAIYNRIIRWVLSAAICGGWAIGMVTNISDVTVSLWLAFLAGGIILNTIRDEIPSKEHSRYWPFFLGATSYAALILLIELIAKQG